MSCALHSAKNLWLYSSYCTLIEQRMWQCKKFHYYGYPDFVPILILKLISVALSQNRDRHTFVALLSQLYPHCYTDYTYRHTGFCWTMFIIHSGLLVTTVKLKVEISLNTQGEKNFWGDMVYNTCVIQHRSWLVSWLQICWSVYHCELVNQSVGCSIGRSVILILIAVNIIFLSFSPAWCLRVLIRSSDDAATLIWNDAACKDSGTGDAVK